MKKKISIIIPVYNAENYLEECIKSCLYQSWNHYEREIIIIDDGSTDSSGEIIEKYRDNKSVRAIRGKNQGGSMARNAGLDIANGDYVYFLDADDKVNGDVLECAIMSMEEMGADLCVGNYKEIDQNGKELRAIRGIQKTQLLNGKEKSSLFGIYPNPSTKLYKKKIIDKYGIRFDSVRVAQDLNFFLKYLVCCERVLVLDKYFYDYRIVDDSISRKYDDRVLDIIKSFEGVRKFISKEKSNNIYERDLNNVELKHIGVQTKKAFFISEKCLRLRILKKLRVRFFSIQPDRSRPSYRDSIKTILKTKIILAFYRISASSCVSRIARRFERNR